MVSVQISLRYDLCGVSFFKQINKSCTNFFLYFLFISLIKKSFYFCEFT